MTNKEIQAVLDEEIYWAEESLLTDKTVSIEFKKGYIEGLKQAKFLFLHTVEGGRNNMKKDKVFCNGCRYCKKHTDYECGVYVCSNKENQTYEDTPYETITWSPSITSTNPDNNCVLFKLKSKTKKGEK